MTAREHWKLPGGKLWNLDLLPPSEAVESAADAAGRRLPRRDRRRGRTRGLPPHPAADDAALAASPLGRLAALCGRLPLALRVAAGHLCSYEDVRLDDYCSGWSGPG